MELHGREGRRTELDPRDIHAYGPAAHVSQGCSTRKRAAAVERHADLGAEVGRLTRRYADEKGVELGAAVRTYTDQIATATREYVG